MVQSLAVKAFMNVFILRRIMEKKGSRTGKLFDPQSAVCSRIWATPVESLGVVRKATPKQLLSSSLLR